MGVLEHEHIFVLMRKKVVEPWGSASHILCLNEQASMWGLE